MRCGNYYFSRFTKRRLGGLVHIGDVLGGRPVGTLELVNPKDETECLSTNDYLSLTC